MSRNTSPEMLDGIQRSVESVMPELQGAGLGWLSSHIPSWNSVTTWFSGLFDNAPSWETARDSALELSKSFVGEAVQIVSDNAVPVAKGIVLGSAALEVTKRGLEEAGYTGLSSKIPSPIQMAGKAVGKAVLFMGAGHKAPVLKPVEMTSETLETSKKMDVESPKETAVKNEKAEVEDIPLEPKIASIFGKYEYGAEVIAYLSNKSRELLNKGGESLASTFMKMMPKSKPGAEGTYLDAVRSEPKEAEILIENMISQSLVEAANSSRPLTPRRGLGTPNRKGL